MNEIDTTLVAAVIAAVAAMTAAALGVVSAASGRRVARRTHGWERLTWAVGTSTDDATAYDISTSVLRDLASVRWMDRSDRVLAASVARRRERRGAGTAPDGTAPIGASLPEPSPSEQRQRSENDDPS